MGILFIYISSASTTFISDVQLETWLEPRTGESNGFTGFESALFTVSCGVEDPVTEGGGWWFYV